MGTREASGGANSVLSHFLEGGFKLIFIKLYAEDLHTLCHISFFFKPKKVKCI